MSEVADFRPLPTDVRAMVEREAGDRSMARFGVALRAVVLTGSLARDEATVARQGSGLRIAGDAELLLVFEDRQRLPGGDAIGLLAGEVEAALREAGLSVPVTLSAVPSAYLSRLEPHIFAYELRECGRVIRGDVDVLERIPPFGAGDIPLEDGWRTLCNRMIEVVEAAGRAAGVDDPALLYRLVKLYLDMGTSFLLFAGAYVPTYYGRMQGIRALAQGGGGPSLPFPLESFSDRVEEVTRYKLDGAAECLPGGADLLDGGVAHARALWRWQLSRLCGHDVTEKDADLLGLWIRRQPLATRWRGWAYAARRHGLHRLPGWLAKAVQASPRHWIVQAASELFFRLPGLLRGEEVDAGELGRLHRLLPLPSAPEPSGWRPLAAAISTNYHQLLVGTRS